MKFYALIHEFDDDYLSKYNVVYEETVKNVKKLLKTTNNFKEITEFVRKDFFYHFGSKCEYEFVTSNWTGKDFEQKIDVYMQLEPNVENITRLILLDLKYIEHNGKVYKFNYNKLEKQDKMEQDSVLFGEIEKLMVENNKLIEENKQLKGQ